MKKFTSFIIILLTLVSCSEKTPQDLFEESKSGVVLILNEYYYVMKLPNGNSIYFTGIDEDGDQPYRVPVGVLLSTTKGA